MPAVYDSERLVRLTTRIGPSNASNAAPHSNLLRLPTTPACYRNFSASECAAIRCQPRHAAGGPMAGSTTPGWNNQAERG